MHTEYVKLLPQTLFELKPNPSKNGSFYMVTSQCAYRITPQPHVGYRMHTDIVVICLNLSFNSVYIKGWERMGCLL